MYCAYNQASSETDTYWFIRKKNKLARSHLPFKSKIHLLHRTLYHPNEMIIYWYVVAMSMSFWQTAISELSSWLYFLWKHFYLESSIIINLILYEIKIPLTLLCTDVLGIHNACVYNVHDIQYITKYSKELLVQQLTDTGTIQMRSGYFILSIEVVW